MCGEASDGFAAARATTCGWCEAERRGRYGARRVPIGGGDGRREADTSSFATDETSAESGSGKGPEEGPEADVTAGEAEVEGGASMGNGRRRCVE